VPSDYFSYSFFGGGKNGTGQSPHKHRSAKSTSFAAAGQSPFGASDEHIRKLFQKNFYALVS
jgi:hypothetical protein